VSWRGEEEERAGALKESSFLVARAAPQSPPAPGIFLGALRGLTGESTGLLGSSGLGLVEGKREGSDFTMREGSPGDLERSKTAWVGRGGAAGRRRIISASFHVGPFVGA
jgi:hypothetical protein